MADSSGRKREVSLAVLGQQIVDELAASTKPPPDGAFTVYDVLPRFNGLSVFQVQKKLKADTRLTSKIYRDKRYYWAKK